MVYLSSWVQSMVANSKAETAQWKGLVEESCSPHGTQEADSEKGKAGDRNTHPSSQGLSDPSPARPHLLPRSQLWTHPWMNLLGYSVT